MDTPTAVNVGAETTVFDGGTVHARLPHAAGDDLPSIPDLARRGLVAEVIKESVAQMKLIIGAVLGGVMVLGSVLGISGYLKVSALDRHVAHADSVVNAMLAQQKGKSDSLNSAVEGAAKLYGDVRQMSDQQFANYRELLGAYRATAQNASASATEAAETARAASRVAREANGRTQGWSDTMINLRREIVGTADAVDARNRRFDTLSSRVDERVFGLWTAIMDETGENGLFTPLSDSDFDARVIKIHRGSEVTLEIVARTSGLMLCQHRLRLHIGQPLSPPCEMNGRRYEVLVPWAVKQGLSLVPIVGAHYPDRAAIQVRRVVEADTPGG
jgi:hypothetical protein